MASEPWIVRMRLMRRSRRSWETPAASARPDRFRDLCDPGQYVRRDAVGRPLAHLLLARLSPHSQAAAMPS